MSKSRKKRRRFSIRQKMMISYMTLVIMVLCLGVIVAASVYRIHTNASIIYDNHMRAVQSLKSVSQNLREIDRNLVILSMDAGQYEDSEYVFTIMTVQNENEHLLHDYEKLVGGEMELRRYRQCRLCVMAFNEQVDRIIELVEDGSDNIAYAAYEHELTPVKAAAFEMLDATAEMAIRNAEKINAENQRIFSLVIVAASIIVLTSIAAAVTIAIAMSRYFNRRFDSVQELIRRMGAYDVSEDLRELPGDELGETMRVLNDYQYMLRESISRIRAETDEMDDMGRDVSASVRDAKTRVQGTDNGLEACADAIRESAKIAETLLERNVLSEADAAQLRHLVELSGNADACLSGLCEKMADLDMFLEQIAVTADQQNEIASAHREYILRFKTE